MNILPLFLPIYLLLSACSLFNSDTEKFQSVFKAEILGDIYDISTLDEPYSNYSATLIGNASNSLLSVIGIIYDSENYPYRETIGFSISWVEEKIKYSSKLDSILIGDFFIPTSGRYFEVDGDVSISSFYSTIDDQGSITVNIETLGDGREVVYGNFEFTVVATEPLNQFSRRFGQDTLHITNGEYRLLLDDRRE